MTSGSRANSDFFASTGKLRCPARPDRASGKWRTVPRHSAGKAHCSHAPARTSHVSSVRRGSKKDVTQCSRRRAKVCLPMPCASRASSTVCAPSTPLPQISVQARHCKQPARLSA